MGAMADSISQNAFRWRYDDGTEATATWQAATNVQRFVPFGVTVRLRFLLGRLAHSTNGGGSYPIYESVNNGTFVRVDLLGSKTLPSTSPHYVHHSEIEKQLGSGIENAVVVNKCMSGDGFIATTGNFTWVADSGNDTEQEMEYALIFPPGNFSDGDTIEYRLREGGNELNAGYNEVPIVTIVKGGIRISGGTLTIRNNA